MLEQILHEIQSESSRRVAHELGDDHPAFVQLTELLEQATTQHRSSSEARPQSPFH